MRLIARILLGVQPEISRTISVATVTFIVRAKWQPRFVESQNAAIRACGNHYGFFRQRNGSAGAQSWP